MRDNLHALFTDLIRHLESTALDGTSVVRSWSPIPYFGDLSSARVATVGLNPSYKAFEDMQRSDHPIRTLKSLGLTSWAEARDQHVRAMKKWCDTYFQQRVPYFWFHSFDPILTRLNASYKHSHGYRACHLDLVPYVTKPTWSKLNPDEQKRLLQVGDLGGLLFSSSVKVLILNGTSVVKGFQDMTGVCLGPVVHDRRNKRWRGVLDSLPDGRSLNREILVLGFNHHIQWIREGSEEIIRSISDWIAREGKSFLDGPR